MKILLAVLFLFTLVDFSYANIKSIKGNSINLNKEISIELKNKPSVFIFISKDCPCSRGNIDYINQLVSEFSDFEFYMIHAKKNASNELIKEYLDEAKLKITVLNDSKLELSDQFGALKTPHAFIVNKEGEIIYNGGITNSTFPKDAKKFYLKDALLDLKNNRPISVKESRTLGCFIVR